MNPRCWRRRIGVEFLATRVFPNLLCSSFSEEIHILWKLHTQAVVRNLKIIILNSATAASDETCRGSVSFCENRNKPTERCGCMRCGCVSVMHEMCANEDDDHTLLCFACITGSCSVQGLGYGVCSASKKQHTKVAWSPGLALLSRAFVVIHHSSMFIF